MINYLLNIEWVFKAFVFFLSRERREIIYINRLRNELLYWGYDAFEMNDDEIKDGLLKVSNLYAQFGVTKEELAQTLQMMRSAFKENQKPYLN